jgi:GNAT superfamily N-acetyltransferase
LPDELKLPGEALFGMYEAGRLLAIGGLNRDPFLHDPQVGRVRHVYVLSAYRRQGMGRLLMQGIIEAARQSYQLLTLRTFTEPAASFYQALGFRTEPPIPAATHHLQLTPIVYYPASVGAA